MAGFWIQMLQVLGRGLRDTFLGTPGAMYPPAEQRPAKSKVPRRTRKYGGPPMAPADSEWKSRRGPANTYGCRSFNPGGTGLNRIREHLFGEIPGPKGGTWYTDEDGGRTMRMYTERPPSRQVFNVWVHEHQAAECVARIKAALPEAQLVGTMSWRRLRGLAFRYGR